MSLRKITIDAPIFNQNTKIIQCDGQEISAVHRKWENMTCKLVTPMYGGGVENATPDVKQPIRVSAIRGQLRFWWRILAKNKFEETKSLSDELFRQAEFALWGGMTDGDESGKASAVFLRVKNVLLANTVLYTKYADKMSDILSYVLFPARPEQGKPHSVHLFKPELTWELEWFVDKDADIFWSKKKENGKEVRDQFLNQKYQDCLSQVKETLRWWATFGGIGARTRRGCGAFVVEKSSLPEIENPISETEIQAVNCKLALAKDNSNNAMSAWKLAVQRLRNFRQGVGVGRNEPSKAARAAGKPAGCSRWTEPEAIRRITETYPDKHKPEPKGDNLFPRGMFGMPIIFHFPQTEKVANEKIPTNEPKDTSLQPVGKERMSSPVIIRPILQNGQWQAAALLLPHDFSTMKVELKEMETKKLHNDVKLWDKEKANEITPIQDNGGGDPLTAFLSYFAKAKD